MSTAWGERDRERASTASVMVPSSILTPPMPALKAMPTEQKELFAAADTWPAHRVPCLLVSNKSYLKEKSILIIPNIFEQT